jgi:hypothetical protein
VLKPSGETILVTELSANSRAVMIVALESWCLLVQDNIQEGSVDMEPAIVSNEA